MRSGLFLAALLMTISSVVFACGCLPNDSIVNEYKEANIVFKGRVIQIDTIYISDTSRDVISSKNRKPHTEVWLSKYLAVKFAVVRLLKEKNQSMVITVITSALGTRCGFGFDLNLDYIVYGYNELVDLVDKSDLGSYQNHRKKIKTSKVIMYSTSSCTRTTPWIKEEISELKKNKLIE